jgi:hypothetical protein
MFAKTIQALLFASDQANHQGNKGSSSTAVSIQSMLCSAVAPFRARSDSIQFTTPECRYLTSSNPLCQKKSHPSGSPFSRNRRSRPHRLYLHRNPLTRLRIGMVSVSVLDWGPSSANAKVDSTDCVRFQEALFARQIVFVAGVAEAKSKGRGEECISQNLRILRSRNGTQTIMFFANSQRKERKGYISIPGKGRA